jgi:hypothetical protein
MFVRSESSVVYLERSGVDDGYVEPTTVALSTTEYHELWRADAAPQFPTGVKTAPRLLFPGLGGYRFFILTIPSGDATRTLRTSTWRPVFESCRRSCREF